MSLNFVTRNCEVNAVERSRMEEKLDGLERLWPRVDDVLMRATYEHGRYVAEITVISGGLTTRGEDRADNIGLAFDTAYEKLERQLRRYKKKVQARERRHDNRDDVAGTILHPRVSSSTGAPGGDNSDMTRAGDEDEAHDGVVRLKRFALKPMSPEEAAEQMDLLGHSFFVFRDADNNQVSVVYRRRSGGVGLIEPVAD